MNKTTMILCAAALSATVASGETTVLASPGFHLSLAQDGVRNATPPETLTVSPWWESAAGTNATALVQVDGAFLGEADAEGTMTWMPPHDGTFVLTHTTMEDGRQVGETLTATFVVSGVTPPNAVWYVDATNGVDTADGFSWATAKKTIQAAIGGAVDGNTIIVTNGVYGPIASDNKSIVIQSVNGAESTVIDGGGTNRCATLGIDFVRAAGLDEPLQTKTLLSGFTLQNGLAKDGGGARFGTLVRCEVFGNVSTNYAGGIDRARISYCVISNNSGASAGGISSCIADNCLVVGNFAQNTAGGCANSWLLNCTIAGNSVTNENAIASNSVTNAIAIGGGGAYACIMNNCILWDNKASVSNSVYGCECHSSCAEEILAGESNVLLMESPFISESDFHIRPDSPALEAGTTNTVWRMMPEYSWNAYTVSTNAVDWMIEGAIDWTSMVDLDGSPRIVGDRVDLGCYEAQTIAFSADAFGVSLNPAEFVYDGTAKEPSVAVTNATTTLVAGSNYTVSYENNVNAGTAKAIVNGAGLYIGSITNEFTITPRPLAVTAEAASKVIGGSDPALTYTQEGLVGGDALTGALVRDAGETVGTYAIRQGTLSAGSNYTLTFTEGVFTVSNRSPADVFEPADIGTDPETGLPIVTITGDQGPLELPDTLGPFILDIQGHSITGLCGSAESGVYNGGPAITFTHEEYGEGTSVIVRNSDPEGRGGIFGGDGADGTATHPAGGNGGPGVLIEDAAVAPSVTIEENVLVQGGRGGDAYAGSGADGGNGGAGIEDRTSDPDDSTIVNHGDIVGGDGGDGADGTGDLPGGNGGNGGAGVIGDVDENDGTITGGNGGNGGDSESGNGGAGGDGGGGVHGDVGTNEGTITGGNGGNGGSSVEGDGGAGGNGGDGVDGNVDDNSGEITGGNGGNGGDSESGNGGAGGDGGDGVHGDVEDNSGTITGGNGGNGGNSDTGRGGDGGNGGDGVDGEVGNNDGTITGGDGGDGGTSGSGDNGNGGEGGEGVTGNDPPGTGTETGGESGTTRLGTSMVVTLSKASYMYDGTAHTPSVTVVHDSASLRQGTDFTVSYENNIDAGTAKAIVTGAGNYIGTLTNTFAITKRPVTLTSGSASKVYDGTPLTKEAVEVTGDGFAAGEGVDIDYTGSQTAAGSSANTFAYAFRDGAKEANYTIATRTGTLTVTRGKVVPADGGEPGEGDLPDGALSRFDAVRVYNGQVQSIDTNALAEALSATLAGEYTVEYALGAGEGGQTEPTAGWTTGVVGVKDVGEAVVWYRVTSPNYEAFAHAAKVVVGPKTITDEMFVLSDDVFFYDGTEKKPSVTVKDGEPSICTADDYTLEYGEKSGAGLTPVTVTGRNNYTGAVTKSFPIKKRPVATPVIGSMSYNGKTRKATVPTDSRWTVVANPGGVNVGVYTNVVLRLTDPENYCWKVDEEETHEEWTFTFEIVRAGNGWSRMPGLDGWAYGETPSVPMMGTPRYGATSGVTYRKRGADVATAVTEMPTLPGQYTARFFVAETENYAGTYKDVDFEITGEAPDLEYTQTTPEPVPYAWLEEHGLVASGAAEAAYEEAAWTKAANGENAVWECYVAGLDPTDPDDRLLAFIRMDADDKPVITWEPDLRTAEVPRVYTVLGKAELSDAEWTDVTEENLMRFRFFKVRAEIAR